MALDGILDDQGLLISEIHHPVLLTEVVNVIDDCFGVIFGDVGQNGFEETSLSIRNIFQLCLRVLREGSQEFLALLKRHL